MRNNVCKICRRIGEKLFLKGERCVSPKCAMIKRAYPPGPKAKRRKGETSDYGKELREKQKLKNWYLLGERQFKNYVNKILRKKSKIEDAPSELVKMLETRLDNVVFRLGFAQSRKQARQMVSHGHFLVNGKPVNIPSFQLKKGDVIELKKTKEAKTLFKNVAVSLKKFQPPSWLSLEKGKVAGKIIGQPNLEEAGLPAEISSVFEFYSR